MSACTFYLSVQRGLRKWPERTEESRSSGASEGVGEREEPTELVCWEDGSRAKAGAGRAGWGGGVVRWNLLQSSRGEVMREGWDRAGAWEWRQQNWDSSEVESQA